MRNNEFKFSLKLPRVRIVKISLKTASAVMAVNEGQEFLMYDHTGSQTMSTAPRFCLAIQDSQIRSTKSLRVIL